jgi:cytochrome c oxidase assembly protein subunit 15
MVLPPVSHRTAAYQPALAWCAAVGGFWVFVLVLLGAFTTSIGAGMAFPDWPLSNGSLNPDGWLGNLAMFAEHAHRLSAGLMGTITLVVFGWVWRREARAWLRRLAAGAVGLVLVQALVGGLRVLLDGWQLVAAETSVGRLFAMLHACLAQVFICTFLVMAVALSRSWIEGEAVPVGAGLRRLGCGCCGLLLVQLAVAAVMRHSFAGLAIPTFPWSTPQGGLLPEVWNFRVGIHFAHRVLALVLAVALPALAVSVWRDPAATRAMRRLAALLVFLLALQILLGVAILRTYRSPGVTTGHVLVGALTLATAVLLTLWAHRAAIQDAERNGSAAGCTEDERMGRPVPLKPASYA